MNQQTPKVNVKTLNQSFTVGFQGESSQGQSIALRQVEGTSCDDIQFDLFNKKRLSVSMQTTAGSYTRLGTQIIDVDEPITFTGSRSAGVGTPGVVGVEFLEVLGDVIALNVGNNPHEKGQFVFDMEMEQIKYTGDQDVYAVVRIKYQSQGLRYQYHWGYNDDIDTSVIAALASDASKASLSLSRTGCKDNKNNNYSDTTSSNTALHFNLVMEAAWTISSALSTGPITLGALLTMYPVHSSGSPELRVSFGKTGTPVSCTFEEEVGYPQFKQLSESVNFSSSSIANLSCFTGSFSNVQIAAESAFFDTKGNRIISPNLYGPGSNVTVQEFQDVQQTIKDAITGQSKTVTVRTQVRYSKTLGPTEIAVTTVTGVLLPVTGTARVNYQVPMKYGVLKATVSMTSDDYKNWFCECSGSYVYTDLSFASGKNLVFMGKVSLGNPMSSSPAIDARSQAIKNRIFS